MDQWIATLTTELLWAEDVGAASRAFRRCADAAGVERVVYAVAGGDRLMYVDATYPKEWLDRYLALDYQSFDPVVQQARRSTLPYGWRFLMQRPGVTEPQRRLFDEAAEFGLRDGISMPFHANDGRLGILSLAFSSTDRLQAAVRAQPRLRLLGAYYHAAIDRLFDARESRHGRLDGRERQCLAWVAEGRSLWDISASLHLPEDAVAAILRGVREKLGVGTLADAVAQATAQGLLKN
ncbi:MAG: LuxR family transcriptional regulator [Actinomycetota bacterium]